MNKKRIKLDLGVMELSHGHRLTQYIEKPTLSYSVSMGVYIFDKKVLKWVPPGSYLDFPELIQKLLRKGEKVFCYPSNDFWLDIGRHEDYGEGPEDFSEDEEEVIV